MKYIYKTFLLIAFLIGVIFTQSCQKKEKDQSQCLRINIVEEPATLDPRKARDLNTIAVMKMLYEGLTRISKDGKVEPALAKEIIISKDYKNYVFHLRKSVWTNGSSISSYDIAKSWREALDPKFPSPMAYQLYLIKGAKEAKEGKLALEKIGITTPDAETLVVDLENPSQIFLEQLSLPIFFPVSKDLKSKDDIKMFYGSGPFVLKQWHHNNNMVLEKNNNYWDADVVRLKKIQLFMVAAEAELKMFETDELDWAGSPFSTIPLDAFSKFQKLDNFYKQPFMGTYFIRINTKEITEKLKSANASLDFRKALFKAVDRETLVKNVLHGSFEKATSLVPPAMKLEDDFTGFENVETSVGYPEPLKFLFSNNERNYLVAQVIQREWEDLLKIKIELEPMETKVLNERLKSGKYQLALGSWIADYNDPINFLEIFKYKNNGTNNTFWENNEFINLLDAAKVCVNIEERKKLMGQAEKILMIDVPIIPLYHLNLCYLKKDNVKDVYISPLGQIDYKWAYVR